MLLLLIVGCQHEDNIPTTPNIKKDSITTFKIIHDTTIVDANFTTSLPTAVAYGDSIVQVENQAQVTCGYLQFVLTKMGDTLIVSSEHVKSYTCVDWTAMYYYKATIGIAGKCNYVKFLGTGSIAFGLKDTVLKL